ncbi:MAG: BspA family leucine-rich repeat surface protein [Bacteroidales bacterium]|nr:BspA family leucine-rich repeat surface protein [Bacteroidales bacterium]
MKKSLFALLAAAAFAFLFSCTKPAAEILPDGVSSLPTALRFDISVTTPATRSAAKTAWSAGDQILVFFNGNAASWLTVSYDGSAWKASATEGDIDTAVGGTSGTFDAVFTPSPVSTVTPDSEGKHVIVGGADAFYLSVSEAAYTYGDGTVALNITLGAPQTDYVEVYVPGATATDKLNVHGTTGKPYVSGIAQSKAVLFDPATHAFSALKGDCNAPISGCTAAEGAVFYGIAVPESDTDFTFVLESGSDARFYAVSGKSLTGGKSITLPAKSGWTDEALRSVLYADGTLVINEKASDGAANAARHGSLSASYGAAPDGASYSANSQVPWYGARTQAKAVEFGSTTLPKSMRFWFYQFTELVKVDVANLDISNNESIKQCFSGCTKLSDIDLSGWTAASNKLLNMDEAFLNCAALTKIDVKAWACQRVQTMEKAFGGCSSLTALDFSTWNVGSNKNFKSMQETFRDCTALTLLNLSGIKPINLTNLKQTFYKINKVVEMNLEGWGGTLTGTALQNTFSNCSKVKTLDMSGFDVSGVTDTQNLFRQCVSLTTIYASPSQDWSVVSKSTNMFYSCTSLVGGNGTTFDASKLDNTYARIDTADAPGYFTAR